MFFSFFSWGIAFSYLISISEDELADMLELVEDEEDNMDDEDDTLLISDSRLGDGNLTPVIAGSQALAASTNPLRSASSSISYGS